jgi:predicted RNA-binding protein with PUA-like domain
MNYWLVKSEPFKYSWDQFLNDGQTFWDGVRNYAARNNLRDMKKGEKVLFYHSNEGLCVVGIAEVLKEAYQDPGTDDERWLAVDLKPKKTLKKPVTLAAMKQNPALQQMDLIRIGRLSVCKLTADEYATILAMAGEKS